MLLVNDENFTLRLLKKTPRELDILQDTHLDEAEATIYFSLKK